MVLMAEDHNRVQLGQASAVKVEAVHDERRPRGSFQNNQIVLHRVDRHVWRSSGLPRPEVAGRDRHRIFQDDQR